jgi:hypothetical protein
MHKQAHGIILQSRTIHPEWTVADHLSYLEHDALEFEGTLPESYEVEDVLVRCFLDEVEVGVHDAVGDNPDVGEDDAYHDICQSLMSQLPLSLRHAVAQATGIRVPDALRS